MTLPASLLALHRDLGIPPTYAAERGLAFQPEADASTLVQVAVNADGRPIRLVPAAADAWHRLHAAAAADGVALFPVSGFRSVARQAELIRSKLAAGQALAAILRYVAAPGYSEHHTAHALDIAARPDADLTEDFAGTPAHAWLERRAGDFGFHLSYPRDNPHGIGYEPWHWCWAKAQQQGDRPGAGLGL